MKILVVEDEDAIRDLICINLELAGYEVFSVEDGISARDFLEKQNIDLILLDVMIPGIDGFTLIEEIKKYNKPIIFVTAKESVVDRVKGLRLGAEDYIVKPFETMELLARIEVVLRRYNKEKQIIKFKDIEVDVEKRVVKLNNEEVYLTAKEYDLLLLFLQNKNMAISREQILDKVWGFSYEGETRTVDIHVQRIREKLLLKDSLKTVFKVGYRLED